MSEVGNEARYDAFFLRCDFKLIAGRAEQPIERSMRLEEKYAMVNAGPSPIIWSVKIAETHSVIEIDVVNVLFGQSIVDENVIVGGDKEDVPKLASIV